MTTPGTPILDVPTAWAVAGIRPRARVVSDNDYAGDPDGLVQLAHHLLSPSVDVRAVVASLANPLDPTMPLEGQLDRAVEVATLVGALAGRPDVPVVAGCAAPMSSRAEPRVGPAPRTIIAEAMRDDVTTPLFVTCGGGLTAVASAWLLEPRIAERLTVIWIGGDPGDMPIAPDEAGPWAGMGEYNTGIDQIAVQVVFNDSDLRVWQVPSNVYSQVLASRAELLTRVWTAGPLGRYLYEALGAVVDLHTGSGNPLGETYVLGDSPLVLLTALWNSWSAAPDTSEWVDRPRRVLDDSGKWGAERPDQVVREYTRLDTRLLLEDVFAKLALHGRGRAD